MSKHICLHVDMLISPTHKNSNVSNFSCISLHVVYMIFMQRYWFQIYVYICIYSSVYLHSKHIHAYIRTFIVFRIHAERKYHDRDLCGKKLDVYQAIHIFNERLARLSFVSWDDWTHNSWKYHYYRSQLCPKLVPLIFSPSHNFHVYTVYYIPISNR